jgi:hypothetical protein
MANFLSMVFTGLVIIQPNGHLSAINADEHKLIVRLDDRTFEVNESLAFEGFDASEDLLAGFAPGLSGMFSTRSEALQIEAERVLGFPISSGPISLLGDSPACGLTSQPTLFQRVVWEGRVTPDAAVVIDGRRHSLGLTKSLSISSAIQGGGESMHVPAFMSLLQGKGNNLMNCPLVSLR